MFCDGIKYIYRICGRFMIDVSDHQQWVMWNLALVHLETMLVSVQDRCMFRARQTTGLEIILDAPDGTTR